MYVCMISFDRDWGWELKRRSLWNVSGSWNQYGESQKRENDSGNARFVASTISASMKRMIILIILDCINKWTDLFPVSKEFLYSLTLWEKMNHIGFPLLFWLDYRDMIKHYPCRMFADYTRSAPRKDYWSIADRTGSTPGTDYWLCGGLSL